jgi:hypothetical protein
MERQPKKSEKLEVRLPYGEKVRFMDRVTAHGQSVSQVLRTLIKDYSDPVLPSTEVPTQRLKFGGKHWVLGGLLLVGALAGAFPVSASRNLFQVFDRDDNGRITSGEITSEGDLEILKAMDEDDNGWIAADEFVSSGTGISFKETSDDFHNGKVARRLDFVQVKFELAPDGKVQEHIKTGSIAIPFDINEADLAKYKMHIERSLSQVK